MARDNRKETNNNPNLMNNRRIRRTYRQLSNVIGSANLSLYGTDRNSDVDSLNNTFQNMLHNEIGSIIGKNEGDTTSFLSKISSKDRKNNVMNEIISNQFMSVNGDGNSALQSFVQEAYKNRLVEQADLHEVASQLIELNEAILITRDAIVSADVVEGRMSRTLEIENATDEDSKDYIPLIEFMERKFKLQEKIKNFIIPKTLEYGEYYVYTIPYSKIFNDFMKSKNNMIGSQREMYHESTLLEYVTKKEEKDNVITEKAGISPFKFTNHNSSNKKSFADQIYKEYCDEIDRRKEGKIHSKYEEFTGESASTSKPEHDSFVKDINNMMSNITICNDAVPIPVMEEGIESMKYLRDEYITESGDSMMTEARRLKVTPAKTSSEMGNTFRKNLKVNGSEGIIGDSSSSRRKQKGEFDEFTDCYIKMMDPIHVIPVKIMSKVIGYYYIEVEDITPLSGAVSSSLYYAKYDETAQQQTVIDQLARAIVDSFDKDFLKGNEEFKETIVEAIQYYNLNEKKLKFQYIPKEYMQDFKINEDENGNGQSMIKKSLFYAKLYLMLLLFKIMSIIMNSNDMKVNYIRQSGIDTNVANKVQEIARIKQSRQINMYDLFNYTTLINKVGNGSEMYVPMGRSDNKPIETEILSGQDIQLNTDLLENLKNSYILGTGVPAAIVNYMNEADFAKVIEQNNTKFNGRVVNYQLDFNSSITDWYKKIMKWSTQIPDTIIDNFKFILQPPKTTSSNAKAEAINAFQTYSDFVTNLMYGDNQDGSVNPEEIREFKRLLADDQLPMLNLQSIEEFKKKAKLAATNEKLKPKADNGDNGDDIGLGDLKL